MIYEGPRTMETMFGTAEVHRDYLARLRTSIRRAIGDAKIREQKKAAKAGVRQW